MASLRQRPGPGGRRVSQVRIKRKDHPEGLPPRPRVRSPEKMMVCLDLRRRRPLQKNGRTHIKAPRELPGDVFTDRAAAAQDVGNTPLRGAVREIVLFQGVLVH